MTRALSLTSFIFSWLLLANTGLVAQRLRLSEHEFGENDKEKEKKAETKQPADMWAAINTNYRETRPYISSDGNRLYFSRGGHPDNVGGERDEMDIWEADWSSDSLNANKISNLGAVVNSKGLDAISGMSDDGKHLYVFNYEWVAPITHLELIDGNWKVVESIKIKGFYNRSEYLDLFFSTKVDAILMAISREGSLGQQDLFVSLKDGSGEWDEPVSLGPGINTTSNDFAPFLGSDGRSLFYCSEGLTYEGGADIYYSYRIDDTWKNWTAPVNLGKQINAKEEVYVSVTGDFKSIFIDSFSKADSNRNISKMDLPEAFHPKNKTSYPPVKMITSKINSAGDAEKPDTDQQKKSIFKKRKT
jgi:OmpA-OmpF porin, OOP family